MIRLIILAMVLSMLSGTLGAGLAACRNWTMGPATEAGTTAAVAPDPAATRHNTPPSETDRQWAALERERAARRAAERRLERIAQPRAAHAGPERQQPPAPPAPAATAEPSRNEPIPAPSPAPATQATPTAIPAGTAITVRTAAAATSATARVEDAVSATTVSEVMIDGQTVIPAGGRMLGSVTAVERAGRMSGSDRITVLFHTLVYNGVETALETAPVTRAGPGQTSQNATRIGGGALRTTRRATIDMP
ncbi:MAG: hypothetical protein OXG04_20520 [Acidobacteria bacterium]|nr:hypothetical protein [Acidobacteriota bacterium]